MIEDKNVKVRVKFKDGAFVPIEKISHKFAEEEIIEMEIRKKKIFSWRGALKNMNMTAVELQHKIRDI